MPFGSGDPAPASSAQGGKAVASLLNRKPKIAEAQSEDLKAEATRFENLVLESAPLQLPIREGAGLPWPTGIPADGGRQGGLPANARVGQAHFGHMETAEG